MAFGIAAFGIIPMRRDKSERSEMISQLLFGELYEILEENEKWLYVRLVHDGSEGWIQRGCHTEMNAVYVEQYRDSEQIIVDEVFQLVIKDGDWENQLVVAGSVLPFYDVYQKKLRVGEEVYFVLGNTKEVRLNDVRSFLIQYALMYYNTPYLYGGRTPYGIDCSGLTQMVYRLLGVALPRKVVEQAYSCHGELVSFLEEALPGDLAFFGDDAGEITHVGIIWESGRIIHASGRVRVDKIDHYGIFNAEMKRYTHVLKLIKRFI